MVTSEGTGGADLLWGGQDRAERPARPVLSLDAIAEVATAIADADGIDAVSMQRVAGDLGFTKMSLYRYVASKSELVAVMIDRAVGDPPDLSSIDGGWRARLEEFARLLEQAWHEHPWLPWATVGERMIGPHEVGWIESAVAALDGTDLTGDERLDAVFMLFGHMRNTQSMTTAGTQPWTTDRRFSTTTSGLMQKYGARYPALTQALADTHGGPYDNGRRFGLTCIFDGIETLVERRSSGA
ncbi:MAG TPA: TetR/AcrR family transcriptional regulator C-terminal domain-containing protein [Jiangellaceae bacterium]